jgi:hypothetical protein
MCVWGGGYKGESMATDIRVSMKENLNTFH